MGEKLSAASFIMALIPFSRTSTSKSYHFGHEASAFKFWGDTSLQVTAALLGYTAWRAQTWRHSTPTHSKGSEVFVG